MRGRDRRRSEAGHNQYPPGHRRPRAARTRSPSTSSASTASTYDPDTEVLVTAGATEAIAAAILALCEPGDEVVTFEPYYDSYAACIAHGRRATRGRDAPRARLRASTSTRCGARSRRARSCVLLNSPHNPTGKVFTRAELELIAELRDRARSARRHRRGLRAPRLRRRARAARDAARHARAHRHDLVGRQDVLVHRLEDRLGLRDARRSSTRCGPRSSSSRT